MKSQQIDLRSLLNSFLALDSGVTHSQGLEEILSLVEQDVQSMRDFLEMLVNTSLWQGWDIEPNPYKAVILTVGSEIDRLATLLKEPAFHSKKHMMDVCLMLSYLLRQEETERHETIQSPWVTSSTEKWQLLLAAAAHDLGHPGLINTTPYELEQKSLDLLKALLPRFDTDVGSMSITLESITPWILATDHGQYQALLNRLSIDPPEHDDCLAMLLVEADLACSVLPVRGPLLTRRLCDEWAGPYPEKSIALRNQVGYLSFLASLQFVSPHSVHAGITTFLQQSLSQLRTKQS
jgi:hypothetical protein